MDTDLLQHGKGGLFVKIIVIELLNLVKDLGHTMLTLSFDMTLNWPWSNIHPAHQLIILDMCAELFFKPTMGSKD